MFLFVMVAFLIDVQNTTTTVLSKLTITFPQVINVCYIFFPLYFRLAKNSNWVREY